MIDFVELASSVENEFYSFVFMIGSIMWVS